MDQNLNQQNQHGAPAFQPAVLAHPAATHCIATSDQSQSGLPPTRHATRESQVDLLRIFAASAIFYYHSGLYANWPFSPWGEFAVATFIYLTSFCSIKYSASLAGPFRTYFWSRFKAIYPTFAIVSLLIIAANFFYVPPKIGSHYTLPDIAANFLIISQYVGKPWMTASMWFVPFVLQVYLILPIFRKIPIRLLTLPFAFLVSGFACVAVYALHPTLPEHAYGICRNWSPIFRLPEVMFGCVLARARNLADVVASVVTYVVYCVLIALLVVVYPQASSTLLLPLKGVVVFLILSATTAFILPLVKHQLAGIIAILGRAAFPFWLLHGPGVTFMGDRFGQNILPWILYFVLCWIGAIAFNVSFDKLQRRLMSRSGPAPAGRAG